ncbi:MAG: hypothetical protein J6V20_03500 [Bacteroidaceae bacterium]|nr:hypothetical protein [Bacteroidaceae bacterium]
MKRYIKNNKVKFRNEIVVVRNGVQVINPTEEMILVEGWQEFVMPETGSYIPSYEERVEQLIREKYSINQELAIQRQRDTKPSEFEEYFVFCEECKTMAKNR